MKKLLVILFFIATIVSAQTKVDLVYESPYINVPAAATTYEPGSNLTLSSTTISCSNIIEVCCQQWDQYACCDTVDLPTFFCIEVVTSDSMARGYNKPGADSLDIVVKWQAMGPDRISDGSAWTSWPTLASKGEAVRHMVVTGPVYPSAMPFGSMWIVITNAYSTIQPKTKIKIYRISKKPCGCS